MNKAERFGHRLARAVEKHPHGAKTVRWCVVVALLFLPVAAAWHAIAQGKAYEIAIYLAIGALVGWRHYRRFKQG